MVYSGNSAKKITYQNIPLEDDKYDGLADGLEEHVVLDIDQSEGADTELRWAFMKVNSLEHECNNNQYVPTFVDNFDEHPLSQPAETSVWVNGYLNNQYPFNLTNNEEGKSLALPEFVRQGNSSLQLVIATNNTGRDTVTFPETGLMQFNNGSGAISTNRRRDVKSRIAGGCVSYGRYTIEARALESNDDKRVVSAVWFYGSAGEVDLYEQCLTSDDNCKRHRQHIHQWSLDDDNVNMHYDSIFDRVGSRNASGDGDHVFYNDDSPGKEYTGRWVDYEMEWTPYAIKIRYDGEEVFAMNRYWKFGNSPEQRRPLTCDEIESGVPLGDVWELLSWNQFRRGFMDLVLSTGIHANERDDGTFIDRDFGDEEIIFDVNRVIFEHQIENPYIQGPQVMCREDNWGNETNTFSIQTGEVLDDPLRWFFVEDGIVPRTGYNQNPFKIFSIPENYNEFTIGVQTDNLLSCVDYTTLRRVRVGEPVIPEFMVENRGCTGVSITADYPNDLATFDWSIIPTNPDLSLYIQESGNQLQVFANDSSYKKGFGFRYFVTMTNECGTNTQEGFHWVRGCTSSYRLKISENPFRKKVRFVVLKDDAAYTRPSADIVVRLVNRNGNLIEQQMSNGAGEINTSLLATDNYYLIVNLPEGGQTLSEQVFKN